MIKLLMAKCQFKQSNHFKMTLNLKQIKMKMKITYKNVTVWEELCAFVL